MLVIVTLNNLFIFLKLPILYSILICQCSGHLFDYIIIKKVNSGVSNLHVSELICDHRTIHVSLACQCSHLIESKSMSSIENVIS